MYFFLKRYLFKYLKVSKLIKNNKHQPTIILIRMNKLYFYKISTDYQTHKLVFQTPLIFLGTSSNLKLS